MSCLCKNTSRYYTPCGCGCGHTCGCHCVNTTSTTTTIAPCINGEACEEAIDPNCIIYCGRDLPCYGIKTGDTAADILNVILALLTDCTTTTTTTIAPTSTSTSTSTSTTSTSTSTTIIPTSTSTTTIIPTSTSTTTIIPTSTTTTTRLPTTTTTTTILPTTTTTTIILPTTSTTTTTFPIVPSCDTQVSAGGDCLSTNGGFDYNLSGWTILGADASWSSTDGGTVALYQSNAVPEVCISQDILTIGNTYQIEFDVKKTTDQLCDYTQIYINVFAGSTMYGPLLETVVDGTVHVSVTLVCADTTQFKICGYNPDCGGGPYLFIDNICITEAGARPECDVNLYITDNSCDPCVSETPCFLKLIPDTPEFPEINFGTNKVGSPSYSVDGTIFRTSVNPIPNNQNGENNVFQLNNTGIWINDLPNDSVNGPMNRCAIQVVNPIPNPAYGTTWYGYELSTTCIDPTLSGKTICIGIGGQDFAIEYAYSAGTDYPILVNRIITNYAPWTNPLDKSKAWNVYEITLPIGNVYNLRFWGTNQPWGFEIYDKPMIDLVNATTEAELNIIFSSLDINRLTLRGADDLSIIESGSPACPNGFRYESCSGQCVSILSCTGDSECAPCIAGPLPSPAYFPATSYGNITLTYSFTGPGAALYLPLANCTGQMDPPSTIYLGYPAGAFTYTVHFSEPVNNIKLLASGLGAFGQTGVYEEFLFDTNAGEPVLTSCDDGCLSYVVDNKLYGTAEYFPITGVTRTGAISFKITAPVSFTDLTITGAGGLFGSIFAICSKDVDALYENYPQLVDVKSLYTTYDIVPANPPSPEPEAYSVYTNYDV